MNLLPRRPSDTRSRFWLLSDPAARLRLFVLGGIGILILGLVLIVNAPPAPPTYPSGFEPAVIGAVSFERPTGWTAIYRDANLHQPSLYIAPQTDLSMAPTAISLYSTDVSDRYFTASGEASPSPAPVPDWTTQAFAGGCFGLEFPVKADAPARFSSAIGGTTRSLERRSAAVHTLDLNGRVVLAFLSLDPTTCPNTGPASSLSPSRTPAPVPTAGPSASAGPSPSAGPTGSATPTVSPSPHVSPDQASGGLLPTPGEDLTAFLSPLVSAACGRAPNAVIEDLQPAQAGLRAFDFGLRGPNDAENSGQGRWIFNPANASAVLLCALDLPGGFADTWSRTLLFEIAEGQPIPAGPASLVPAWLLERAGPTPQPPNIVSEAVLKTLIDQWVSDSTLASPLPAPTVSPQVYDLIQPQPVKPEGKRLSWSADFPWYPPNDPSCVPAPSPSPSPLAIAPGASPSALPQADAPVADYPLLGTCIRGTIHLEMALYIPDISGYSSSTQRRAVVIALSFDSRLPADLRKAAEDDFNHLLTSLTFGQN